MGGGVCVLGLGLAFGIFLFSNGIRLDITPLEADRVARVEVTQGVAFAIGRAVYALSGSPEITVSAPGFRATKESLDFHGSAKVHRILLAALPGQLIAAVKTPYGNATRWFLDGHDLGVLATLTHELEAGEYSLLIDNPYYEKKSIPITINKANTVDLSVELTPVSGEITIASKPAGAELTLDGEIMGKTPLSVTRSGGRYHSTVSLAGYREITDTIEVSRLNAAPHRMYFLQAEEATIKLTLVPDDGVLLHNGVYSDNRKSLRVSPLFEHQLTYQKPGYLTARRTLRLTPKEVAEVRFELTPEFGIVEVSSMPPATLFVNGTAVGETPQSLELAAVPQRLTLSRTGYAGVERTVQPSSRVVKKIHETLLKESAVRLRNASRHYTHKAGGKMKLFMPNEQLTLGAARSEAGQRANELVRTVKLTRPFYAGLHEVTHGEFGQFRQISQGHADHPVTAINWSDAALFCNWLSDEEGLKPFYTVNAGVINGFDPNANGYRLLSEAEWEWLARKSNKEKRTIFTWGDQKNIPPHAANVADESTKGKVNAYVENYQDGFVMSAPVGSFDQEPSGLFDMAGNVSEWVHDYYAITPDDDGDDLVDSLGPRSGRAHVIKGANWRSGTLTELRASFREGLVKGRNDLGFRIGRYL